MRNLIDGQPVKSCSNYDEMRRDKTALPLPDGIRCLGDTSSAAGQIASCNMLLPIWRTTGLPFDVQDAQNCGELSPFLRNET